MFGGRLSTKERPEPAGREAGEKRFIFIAGCVPAVAGNVCVNTGSFVVREKRACSPERREPGVFNLYLNRWCGARGVMKLFFRFVMLQMGLVALQAVCVAQPPAQTKAAPDSAAASARRTIAPYFTRANSQPKAPDADGFLQRWMLLEPIVKPNRTNTVFTGTYVRSAFSTLYFPDQFTVQPHDGDKETVGGQELGWHALDSTGFDVKLFRFADGLSKPTYGVLFWAVTVVNSPRTAARACWKLASAMSRFAPQAKSVTGLLGPVSAV